MLRITLDLQTLPNGTTALDLKLSSLTKGHTADEIEASSRFYEHIASLAATMADTSRGRVSFTPGAADVLQIPITTACSCRHDTANASTHSLASSS